MAVTIRTGANGSYKSAYTAWFIILPALRAGRIVVTNFEGMEPLEVIQERLGKKFPSTTKLIRVNSRCPEGVMLWQHWSCWMPLGALVVIDECQDLFSRNVGFDMKKIQMHPVEHFQDNLPPGHVNFFHSRHVPVDMDNLAPNEIDDCGRAEYDDCGRIIYPQSFNESFMRHRKYDWDVELLSPDWKQIDSAVKACAEQCFLHKNNDGFFWAKRKPYIFKHDKSVSTPSLPKGKDPNLLKVKVPLDAHLLYKSTGTGQVKVGGGMNVLFANPKFLLVLLMIIACFGYVIYGVSNLVFGDAETVEESQEVAHSEQNSNAENNEMAASSTQVPADLSNGGDSNSDVVSGGVQLSKLNTVPPFVPIDSLIGLYMTSFTYVFTDTKYGEVQTRVSLRAKTLHGDFHINDRFLKRYDIAYHVLDECLLELSQGANSYLIGCPPIEKTIVKEEKKSEISLISNPF